MRALAAELGGFRPYGYRVVLDDEVWLSAGSVVAVANTGWFGAGMQIAPQALPDDGLLDVMSMSSAPGRARSTMPPGAR